MAGAIGLPRYFWSLPRGGWSSPGSLNRNASIDGALDAMLVADAAIVGNRDFCPPITLPWAETLPLSLADTSPAFPLPFPSRRSPLACQRYPAALNPWETLPRDSRVAALPPVPPLRPVPPFSHQSANEPTTQLVSQSPLPPSRTPWSPQTRGYDVGSETSRLDHRPGSGAQTKTTVPPPPSPAIPSHWLATTRGCP